MWVDNAYSITKEISEAGPEAKKMWNIIKKTFPFIMKHKIWKGFFEHKWISLLTIGIVLLFTYYFIDFFFVDHHALDQSVREAALDLAAETAEEITGDSKLRDGIKKESEEHFFEGGIKYMLIILQEVLLFHFSVKTQDVLTGNKTKLVFKDFVKVEIRMIKVMIRNFLLGIIVFVFIKFLLFVLQIITPFETSNWDAFLMFFVHSYFLAFALFDNYLEQFHFDINKSAAILRTQLGALTLLGTMVNLLLWIPIIGPLFAPFFASVAATLYSNKYQIQDTPIPSKA